MEPAYNDFVLALAKQHVHDLAVIDVAKHEFDPMRFNLATYTGHPSSYGNRVIATTLAKPIMAALGRNVQPSGIEPSKTSELGVAAELAKFAPIEGEKGMK